MKKAVLLHGTDGSPELIWFPWLRQQLENLGYEVWAPLLPNNHTPNLKTYNDLLFSKNWDFTNNLVVGHSSGAVSVLNLLQDERCPKIDTAILVGIWAKMDDTDLDREQFANLFPPKGYDFEKLKSKTNNFIYFHGDNDPFCPIGQAKWLHERTGGKFFTIPNGGHLGKSKFVFPEIIEKIKGNQT
jgi:predicted alpha/beta hydrolase family esterase